jgi:Predicted transcriptional regulators
MLRIRELRKARKLKQADLANLLGMAQQTISKYENGTVEPDITTMNTLSDFFNVSVDYLLGNTNTSDEEIFKLSRLLARRPELRNLFESGKAATKEQVQKAVKILDILKS